MTTAQFIHDGCAIDYTPTAAVTAGDVIVQGDLVGVARLDIAAGALGSLAVTGVYDLPKTAGVGEAITAGAKVYWNATDSVATTDSDDGGDPAVAYPYLGKTVAAAGDDDTLVRVRLEQ
jgi:predicted RecA/RadA family phage recombinase